MQIQIRCRKLRRLLKPGILFGGHRQNGADPDQMPQLVPSIKAWHPIFGAQAKQCRFRTEGAQWLSGRVLDSRPSLRCGP